MPLPHFTIITQKKTILWLLGGSCTVAFAILLFTPTDQNIRLQNFGQIDSLIYQELSLFNIPDERIRVSEFQVTDDFSRKHYRVDLPVQVSKTHFHTELNRLLRPLRVETMGYVNVPDEELTIHLVYHEKIVRTLDLRVDPDFVRVPHPAVLLIYFDRHPTSSQLDRLRQFDEPVGVVFRSQSRQSLVRWVEALPDEIRHVGIWFDGDQTSTGETTPVNSELMHTLETVAGIHEHPFLLHINKNGSAVQNEQKRHLQSQNISIVEANNMKIISSDDRFDFDRRMLDYSRLARQAGRPHILVKGTDRTLGWLEKWIPRIKSGGVVFVPIDLNR